MKNTVLLLTLILIAINSFSQIDLEKGLVAYYPFDGNALDVKNGNNGYVGGATLTTGQNGKSSSAYSFDGVDDYIKIPHSNVLNFGNNDFTVSIWLKYSRQNVKGQSYSAIFIKASNNGPWDGITTFVDWPHSGKASFRITGKSEMETSSSRLNSNTWTNFVYVRQGNSLKMYINGAFDSSHNTPSINCSNSNSLYLGCNQTNTRSQNYMGLMDELRIYNRALSENEIKELFDKNNNTNAVEITNNDWEILSNLKYENKEILLKRKMNYSEYRTNPNKSKFYKTTLILTTISNNTKQDITIPDYFYSSESRSGFTTPCLLLDPSNKTVCVYVLEKDASSTDYGMTGYAYFLDNNKNAFRKETIFTRANWGWFAFFGGSENGNPTLCHFSYSGYYAMESKRNSDGTWSNYRVGSIKPDVASGQYSNHKNFLITNMKNVDKMTGVTSTGYRLDNQYSPRNNTSRILQENSAEIMAIGLLFKIGGEIVKGLSEMSSGDYSGGGYYEDNEENNAQCYQELGAVKDYTIEHSGATHQVYKVKCKNGENRLYYYVPENLISPGYYREQIGANTWLGRSKEKAMINLCDCED